MLDNLFYLMLLKKLVLKIVVFALFFIPLASSFSKPAFAMPIFNNPPAGSTISDTVIITVTDPIATKMDFYLYRASGTSGGTKCRDILLEAAPNPPGTFQVSFNTTTVSDGNYALSVKAYYPGNAFNQIYQGNPIANGLSGGYCENPTSPSVDIKANGQQGPITISSGQEVPISWTSVNMQGCTIFSDQRGAIGSGPSGSVSSGALSSTDIFTANCFGKIGSDNDSVTVNISSSGSPPSSSPPTSGPPSGSPPPAGSTGGSSGNTSSGGSSTTTGQKTVESITPELLSSSDKIVVEQDIPVSIGEFDPDIFLKGKNIKITAIKNIKQDGKTLLHFEGKTKPNTLVTLYVFSNPVIVTVKSDEKGIWTYDRERNIETGKHSAFATIYDDGVTRRSDVSNFFIAKASGGESLILQSFNLTKTFGYVYVFVSAIVIAILILITFRIYQKRRVTT